MPAKRYPVLLDPEQRTSLIGLISSGRESARKQRESTRARILLKVSDESEKGPLMPINKSEKSLKSPYLLLNAPVKPSHLKDSLLH